MTITLIININNVTIEYKAVFVNNEDNNTDVPILANIEPNVIKNNIPVSILITALD